MHGLLTCLSSAETTGLTGITETSSSSFMALFEAGVVAKLKSSSSSSNPGGRDIRDPGGGLCGPVFRGVFSPVVNRENKEGIGLMLSSIERKPVVGVVWSFVSSCLCRVRLVLTLDGSFPIVYLLFIIFRFVFVGYVHLLIL